MLSPIGRLQLQELTLRRSWGGNLRRGDVSHISLRLVRTASLGDIFSRVRKMSKCQATEELCGLYAALFMDAVTAFPAIEGELLRDQDHLCQLVESRGIHVFLVDLPGAGKHLDRCLSTGQYVPSGAPLTGIVSKTHRIPRLFRGLFGLIFDEQGTLKEDYSHEAIFFLRQFYCCGKKTDFDCREGATDETVRNFLLVDRSLPIPDWEWEDNAPMRLAFPGRHFDDWEYAHDALGVRGHDKSSATRLLARLDTVAAFAASSLGPYDPQYWRFRHGPGAIAEVIGPTNKYSWKHWPERLEREFPQADWGFHSYSAWAADGQTTAEGPDQKDHEPYARLVAVPKTYTSPRLIAVEPGAHMWCQQNMLNYFVNRVRDTWLSKFISFDDQTRNQELCRYGSESGKLATIDLKDASDRMTCAVVQRVFSCNGKLLSCMAATRTRVVEIPANYVPYMVGLHGEPYYHRLSKFSTMGNALTFPVQSIVFLIIAITATLLSRGKRATMSNILKLEGEVSVFGDDIIVPVESRVLLQTLLEALCFRVNATKSFSEGNFRESCGLDCMGGVGVTPAYYKGPCNDSPESIARRVDVVNNFHSKFLLNCSRFLAQAIPKHRKVVSVRVHSGVMGLKVFCKPIGRKLKLRINQHLQCTESLVLVVTNDVKKTKVHDDSALLQYFTEDPDPYTQWESGVTQRPVSSLQHRWVNYDDVCIT